MVRIACDRDEARLKLVAPVVRRFVAALFTDVLNTCNDFDSRQDDINARIKLLKLLDAVHRLMR